MQLTAQLRHCRWERCEAPSAKHPCSTCNAPELPAQDDGTVHWPGFRGPDARGVAVGPQPPAAFDVQEGLNVRWRVPVPGLAVVPNDLFFFQQNCADLRAF